MHEYLYYYRYLAQLSLIVFFFINRQTRILVQVRRSYNTSLVKKRQISRPQQRIQTYTKDQKKYALTAVSYILIIIHIYKFKFDS